MREIKFDVILWDGSDPATIQHYSIDEAVREDIIDFSNGTMKPRDESVIIREYAGSKDKNIKEIYEGDIVTNRLIHDKLFLIERRIDVENNCFLPVEVGKRNDRLGLFTDWRNFEIIGNIYENPELVTN